MTVIGLTADGKKIVHRIESGPSSGAWTVTLGELQKIEALNVSVKTHRKTDNLVEVVDYAVSGNTITFTVYTLDVTGTSPVAWTEDTGDRSGLTLEIIAIGY